MLNFSNIHQIPPREQTSLQSPTFASNQQNFHPFLNFTFFARPGTHNLGALSGDLLRMGSGTHGDEGRPRKSCIFFCCALSVFKFYADPIRFRNILEEFSPAGFSGTAFLPTWKVSVGGARFLVRSQIFKLRPKNFRRSCCSSRRGQYTLAHSVGTDLKAFALKTKLLNDGFRFIDLLACPIFF